MGTLSYGKNDSTDYILVRAVYANGRFVESPQTEDEIESEAQQAVYELLRPYR